MPEDDVQRANAPVPRTRAPLITAPISWRNWRASLDDEPLLAITECMLFSEAWFIAEAHGYGPYSIINPVTRTTHVGGPNEWKPALALRVGHHLPSELPDMLATAADHYHGGGLEDEIAALVALILNTRIAAGPIEREFVDHGDPLGRPYAHAAGRLPVLPQTPESHQIPSLLGQRDLREMELLGSFPRLPLDAAATLVKSARSYQQALWMSDAAPELAWLLFVSALEAAAGFWDTVEHSPSERLARSYPGLVRTLRDNDQEQLVGAVAQELHKVIGATGKFVSFCLKFKPDPPVNRPTIGAFDFGSANYRDAIEKIYHHRSRALHGGVPFPYPMCMPPQAYDNVGPVAEKPLGLAAFSYNATWMAKDYPMHLHLFAYLTRGALLNWWRTLAGT